MNGITYYKFESTYDGDSTKYCSLTATEVDKNFNFLRGKEINDVKWVEKDDALVITLLNGEKFEVTGLKTSILEDFGKEYVSVDMDGTYFDRDTLLLHLVINGHEFIVNGFDGVNSIYTDDTINGNATKDEPLSISKTVMSGYHLPCKCVIDTVIGNELPSAPNTGDMFVTIEPVNKYGVLYNYDGVNKISAYLKSIGSKWRIPSSEEWGEILNYTEECDKQEHNSLSYDTPLGEQAGLMLKARDGEWSNMDPEVLSLERSYNFDVYPTGFSNEGKEIDGIGEIAVFWTNDVYEDEAESRVFSNDFDGVIRTLDPTEYYASVRLIRDFDNDYTPIEVIDGVAYPITPMKGINEDGDVVTCLWTKNNLYLKDIVGEDYIDIPDNNGLEEHLFINAWDGSKWQKRELLEGETVVLNLHEGHVNEEWTIFGNELVRKNDLIYSSMKDDINELLSESINAINKEVNGIKTNINNISKNVTDTEKEVTSIKETLDGKSDINDVKELSKDLDKVSKKFSEDMKTLSDSIAELLKEVNANKELLETIKDGVIKANRNYMLKPIDSTIIETTEGDGIKINFDGNFGTI